MRYWFGLLMLYISLPALACELPASRTVQLDEDHKLFVRFATTPQTGEYFALDLLVCRAEQAWSPARLKIDVTMPAHRHGMNYRPQIKPLATGRYSAKGFLLHMPGHWRFHFDLAESNWRKSASFDYHL